MERTPLLGGFVNGQFDVIAERTRKSDPWSRTWG